MKFLKAILIFIIVFAVLAGGLVAIDYFTGFDIGIFDTADLEENTYEVTESYSKLIVETMVVDIEMAPSDTEITQIYTKNREGLGIEYVVENDTLRITQKDNRKWYQKTGIFAKHNVLRVSIPTTFSGDIVVKNNTGDIAISGITANNFSIEGDSGDIAISGITANNFSIEGDSGDIAIADVTSQNFELENDTGDIAISGVKGGKFDISTETGNLKVDGASVNTLILEDDTGDITLENAKEMETLTIENDTGDVVMKNVYALSVNAKTDTGNIEFIDFDGKDIRLEADTGDIIGNILSPKIYEAHTSTGNVEVPRSEPVDSRCYVRTHTGDITIE